jgi:hypothetical protein
MTKKEKIIIKQAIKDLTEENGDFSGAIAKLCRMVGWRHPAGEVPKNLPSTTLQEYMSTHPANQEFKAKI